MESSVGCGGQAARRAPGTVRPRLPGGASTGGARRADRRPSSESAGVDRRRGRTAGRCRAPRERRRSARRRARRAACRHWNSAATSPTASPQQRDPQAAGVLGREQEPGVEGMTGDRAALHVLLEGQQDDGEDRDPGAHPAPAAAASPGEAGRCPRPRRCRLRPGAEVAESEPQGGSEPEQGPEGEARLDRGAPRAAVAGVDERLAVQGAVASEKDELVREHECDELQAAAMRACKTPRHAAHSSRVGAPGRCPTPGRGAGHDLDRRMRESASCRVGEFTAEETAIRAEVDPADLDRYVSAGVIEPDADGRFSTGHVRRIRITRSLERSGLPIDGLAVAMRQGLVGLDFADTPTYERFDPLGHETFEQAAERCALPVELLLTVRESMGYALPRPTDRIGQDELDVVPLLRFMVDNGCRQPVIERSLRTYGESLRRVAETEADWWNSELLQPLFRRGVTYQELFKLTSRLSGELVGLQRIRRSGLSTTASRRTSGCATSSKGSRGSLCGPDSTSDSSAPRHRLSRPDRLYASDQRTRRRGSRRPRGAAQPPRAADVDAARREAGEVAGRRGHVPFPGPGERGHRVDRDGGRSRALGAAAGARRRALGSGAVPGWGLLRADGERRVAHRGLRAPGRGAGEPGRGGRGDGWDPGRRLGRRPAGVSFTPIGPVELKGVSEPIVLYAARREAARQD